MRASGAGMRKDLAIVAVDLASREQARWWPTMTRGCGRHAHLTGRDQPWDPAIASGSALPLQVTAAAA